MQRNPSIHGLRGLAAGMVLALHLYGAMVTGGLLDSGGLAGRLEWLFAFGHRGVELFFLISGYLIAGSLVRHRSATRFLAHRLRRIYPAFLVPHLLIFAVGPWVGYGWMAGLDLWGWIRHFFANLLLLPGLFDLPIANIVAWTLSLEMAFYLLAAAAWLIGQQRSPWRKAAARVGWLAIAAVMILRHPRTAFFAAGVLAWWLHQRHAPIARAVQRVPFLGLAGFAGLCLLFDRAFAASLLCGWGALLAIAGNRGPLCRLLAGRPLQYLGDISYSLYLWHPLVLFGLKRGLAPALGTETGRCACVVFFLASALAGSLCVAELSYRWIEQRFRRHKPADSGRRCVACQPQKSPASSVEAFA